MTSSIDWGFDYVTRYMYVCAAGLLKYVGVFNEIIPCYFTIYNLYIGIKAHLKLSLSH